MKWTHNRGEDFDSKGWLEADTPAGEFVVEETPRGFVAAWWPPLADMRVAIGYYRTQGAAKGACKRYAKRMAAAFKAMGRAGWQ